MAFDRRLTLPAIAGLVFLGALVLGRAAETSSASTASATASGKVLKLQLPARSQSGILAAGSVRVRAKPVQGEPGSVRASVALASANGRARRISKGRAFELDGPGYTSLKLPLTRRGRAAVAG